jgi:hypothetical protein
MVLCLVVIEFFGKVLYTTYLNSTNQTREQMEMKMFFEKGGYTEFAPYRLNKLIPNTTTRYFNINEAGFRGDRKPSKTKNNVFILGGSTVFGVGVNDDETISYFLQECLDFKKDNQYEVINAGVTGYSTNEEAIYALREIRLLNPYIIIFIDGRNDAYYSVSDSWTIIEPHGSIPALKNAVNNQNPIMNFYRIKTYLLQLLSKSDFMKFVYFSTNKKVIYPVSPKYNPDSAELMLFNWNLVKTIFEKDDVKTLFFLQPTLLVDLDKLNLTSAEMSIVKKVREQSPDYISILNKQYKHFKNISKGFEYFDLTQLFDKFNNQKYLDDCHYTKEANKLIAYTICEKIE